MGLSEQNMCLVEADLGSNYRDVDDADVHTWLCVSGPEDLERLLNAARAEERKRLSAPDTRDNMLGSIIETSVEQGHSEATEAQARRIAELRSVLEAIATRAVISVGEHGKDTDAKRLAAIHDMAADAVTVECYCGGIGPTREEIGHRGGCPEAEGA